MNTRSRRNRKRVQASRRRYNQALSLAKAMVHAFTPDGGNPPEWIVQGWTVVLRCL